MNEELKTRPDFQEEAVALMKLFSTSKGKIPNHPIRVDSLDHYDLKKAIEYYHAARVEPLQAEKEELTKKLEFYRSETAKIREFVFNRKDIGYPTQSIFKAITDKLEGLQAENEQLRKLLHDHNNMCQGKLTEQLNSVLPDIKNLQSENQKLREALKYCHGRMAEAYKELNEKLDKTNP